jgi:hypothetical protein
LVRDGRGRQRPAHARDVDLRVLRMVLKVRSYFWLA